MLVQKTLKFDEVSLKMQGDSGTFEGYASKWGGVDAYGDTIVKGAFIDTLKDTNPKMFWNHQWDMPVGKWVSIEEDSNGLFVKGELTPGLSLASDVRAAMKHETLDGLSIGGFLKKGDFEEKNGGRIIHKWSKLMEISPVVFPADNSARIDLASVKHIDFEALLPDCKTERDIERLLRDAGLGKWEAMAIVSRAKVIFEGRDALMDTEAKTTALILDKLQKMCA
jgi:HK97 family phage prohead protease